MPNTYTQLCIHFVFAVKYRKAAIGEEWEDRLQKIYYGAARSLRLRDDYACSL